MQRVITKSYLLGVFNGMYGISADEVLQYLSPFEVNNIYNSFDKEKFDVDNVYHPVHKFLLSCRMDILSDSNVTYEEIIDSFVYLNEVFFLTNKYHLSKNSDDYFDYICGHLLQNTAMDLNKLIQLLSIFAMQQRLNVVSQLFEYLIKNDIQLVRLNNKPDCSFLAFGRYPEFVELFIGFYIANQNTSFFNKNKTVLDSFVAAAFVSLSVWRHSDLVDRLFKKYTEISKDQVKSNCGAALYLPLLVGLTDVMEYWHCTFNLYYLKHHFFNQYHLISEQSWIWLSHPDRFQFWDLDKILTEQNLQNEKLMGILIKSINFWKYLGIEGLHNAMKLDRVDLFNLLIDNLPDDYIDKNIFISPLVVYSQTFNFSKSLSSWYNNTDEDDEKMFENDNLSMEELEKRKRIRYYGKRILQIKGIENCLVHCQAFDITVNKVLLFKWVGSSSVHDGFDYKYIINNLKFSMNLNEVINLPHEDFVQLTNSMMNIEEFKEYRKAVQKGGAYMNPKNVIKQYTPCLFFAFTRSSPIENVLSILRTSKLFKNSLTDSKLNEDIDSDHHPLLIKLLFGIFSCQNKSMNKKEHFINFKRDIEDSREKRYLEGKQDIFEGLSESEYVILDEILSDFHSGHNIVSNMNICKLLKKKYDINLRVVFNNLYDLLPYPLLIEELPDDCLITAITNDENGYFQTLFGKIVFNKEFNYSYNRDYPDFTHSLNLMKRLFDVAKNHLPTLTIYRIDLNSVWLAENYPAQITLSNIGNYNLSNKGMELPLCSILANKHATVHWSYFYNSTPKEVLELFSSDGLKLDPVSCETEINADKFPSWKFLQFALRDKKIKVQITLKILEEYANDPVFIEFIKSHKSQVNPSWHDISMKQIEKYHKILSIVKPCVFNLDNLTNLSYLWQLYVKRTNKYSNIFLLQYNNLLNNATETGNLKLLEEFSKLGLPMKFSYGSIQTAFERSYILTVKWWIKSGLLDSRFKLNLDQVFRNEKILKWADENKYLIDSISYSSVGIKYVSNLFEK